MKLISWNVNGLRACAGKGFLTSLHPKMPIFLPWRNQNATGSGIL